MKNEQEFSIVVRGKSSTVPLERPGNWTDPDRNYYKSESSRLCQVRQGFVHLAKGLGLYPIGTRESQKGF